MGAIDTIATNIASTSKAASASDEIEFTSFRAPSSKKGRGTLMPAATFNACNLLIEQKKRNRQETDEIEESKPRRSARNKKSD